MELNWTTFILEILNFLVLVWLLKRFFYKPVQDVIARRKQEITAQLDQASGMQQEAQVLRKQYENRLVDWEDERRSARKQLEHEIDQQRLQMIAELQQELDAERKKNDVLAARKAKEQLQLAEVRAMELGARFSAKLLCSVASAELQSKLIELLMAELENLPTARKDTLLTMLENGKDVQVQIVSAYSLDDTQRQSFQNYFDSVLAHQLRYHYSCEIKLIAGVRITIGPWVIHANLYDELGTFASIAHEK
ncbi:F0F1 ATP synthase subunit delta [Desulfosediminicola flagellatus]|uniref:F0F1 ATP synthase subunit delta n=1 Tax=Desulfosediminicola flagellatus TaxID=2569541 RepID=UPI0010AC8BBB|nr:F0F1 ATP synthase subunit delta [Desulfosediminicola flagellatus]